MQEIIKFEGEIKSNFPQLSRALYQLSFTRQNNALADALNRTGDMVYTRVVRSLTKQTGIQQKQIRKTLRKSGANTSKLQFSIEAKDKFLSLKAFKPRQTKAGISASPWGKRTIFPGVFFGPGDHVFRRLDDSRKIKKLWGPAIPREMIKGETAKAARQAVADIFPPRLEHEINRQIAKAKSDHQV